MGLNDVIRVAVDDFSLAQEYERLASDTRIGGVVSFVGRMRDFNCGDEVVGLSLEHYPGMTEKRLAEIAAEAEARWPLEGVLIIHRYGRLEPGDRIVLVAATSAHRQAALDACAFLIDWLKTKAPFWKLEEGAAGAAWVDARESDDHAAEKWRR